jgi:hypothetical protein
VSPLPFSTITIFSSTTLTRITLTIQHAHKLTNITTTIQHRNSHLASPQPSSTSTNIQHHQNEPPSTEVQQHHRNIWHSNYHLALYNHPASLQPASITTTINPPTPQSLNLLQSSNATTTIKRYHNHTASPQSYCLSAYNYPALHVPQPYFVITLTVTLVVAWSSANSLFHGHDFIVMMTMMCMMPAPPPPS